MVTSLQNPTPYKRLPTDAPTKTRISSFWFTSDTVSQETRLSQQDSYVNFYVDVYVQRWYWKQTTYCVSGEVTQEYLKRLTKQTLFWLVIRNRSHRNPQQQVDHKIRDLSNQPQLKRVTPIALPCTWVLEPIEVWCSSWLTLKRVPYGKVLWEAHCKGFCSKEGPHDQFLTKCQEPAGTQSAKSAWEGVWQLSFRQATINLILEVRNLLTIPVPGCTALT